MRLSQLFCLQLLLDSCGSLLVDVVASQVALLAQTASVVRFVGMDTVAGLLWLSELMIAAMTHVQSVLLFLGVGALLLWLQLSFVSLLSPRRILRGLVL